MESLDCFMAREGEKGQMHGGEGEMQEQTGVSMWVTCPSSCLFQLSGLR